MFTDHQLPPLGGATITFYHWGGGGGGGGGAISTGHGGGGGGGGNFHWPWGGGGGGGLNFHTVVCSLSYRVSSLAVATLRMSQNPIRN